MTNPANDPVLTVRVSPRQDAQSPLATRVIKTGDGEWRWLDDGTQLAKADDVRNWPWPVQPLPEVARILGHPAATAPHSDVVTVPVAPIVNEIRTVIDTDTADAVEVLLYREALPAPVEDTDTPDSSLCGSGTCTRMCDEPCDSTVAESAAPSTVDSSARAGTVKRQRVPERSLRARIMDELDHVYDGLDCAVDARHSVAVDAILAVLPELAEHEKLRSDLCVTAVVAENERRRAEYWRQALLGEAGRADMLVATLGEVVRERSEWLRLRAEESPDKEIDEPV